VVDLARSSKGGILLAGKLDDAGSWNWRRRLPDLRLLLRHVHRQLHELPDRSAGHGLAGHRYILAVDERRNALYKAAGRQIVKLIAMDLKPRDIVNSASIDNSFCLDMAMAAPPIRSCTPWPSPTRPRSVLARPINQLSDRVPYLCKVSPAGTITWRTWSAQADQRHSEAARREGGRARPRPAHGDGKTLGENILDAAVKDDDVIRPQSNPYRAPAAWPSCSGIWRRRGGRQGRGVARRC